MLGSGSHCGSVKSQSQKNRFVILSKLIHVSDFVSHHFLGFFTSWHDVLFLEAVCATDFQG